MVLEDCPTTKVTNEYLKEKILYSFPILEQTFDSKYLSLKEYVYERPQKFYSKKAFEEFLSFLNNEQIKNSDWFKELYHEIEHDINIAVKSLNDVNSLNIHDVFIPDNNIECIRFIDNHIHFNYLKLIEAVYHKFLLFIAHNQRKQRNKPTSGLDIYNCIEEVKKTSFDYLTAPYDNTVRNGIAHGGITYKDFDTVYKGKKGQPVQLSTKDIIKKFDNLLDVCNGLTLAFKIFVILNIEYFQINNLTIPKQFLIQELKALANAPNWQVIDCLENEIVGGRKQLNIFTKNQLIEHQEVNYYAFRTAIIAEYFARGFDRYFFSLESKYSLPGWAGYDGKILERERLKNSTDLSGYQRALEDNMLFFISKIKLPRLIKKIIRYIRLAKIIMPIEYHKYTNYIFKGKYELRETKPHRRGLSLIINDPSVYIYPEYNDDVISLIRNNYKKITKYAIKESKKELSFWHRFLKTKYIRVTIYDTDLRKRHLRGSGLVDSLICSITVNRSKKIKNIDFIGGIPEQKGKYRIIWNGKWKDIKYVC